MLAAAKEKVAAFDGEGLAKAVSIDCMSHLMLP